MAKIERAADALDASAKIIEAVAGGQITPTEASEITALITSHVKILEAVEFEGRLAALEQVREKR